MVAIGNQRSLVLFRRKQIAVFQRRYLIDYAELVALEWQRIHAGPVGNIKVGVGHQERIAAHKAQALI